jgi:hypothetical protein
MLWLLCAPHPSESGAFFFGKDMSWRAHSSQNEQAFVTLLAFEKKHAKDPVLFTSNLPHGELLLSLSSDKRS